MNLAIAIPEAAHGCVLRHVKRKACPSDPLETLHNIAIGKVETLGGAVIVDAHQDQVLARDELCTVDQGVVALATVLTPVYLFEGSAEVSEIPNLDTLSFRAAPCDDQIPVMADVDRFTAYLSAPNAVGDLVRPHIPKFNL